MADQTEHNPTEGQDATGVTRPARNRRARVLPEVPPLETEAGADPAGSPATQTLVGPEPAVFGGVNPPPEPEPSLTGDARMALESYPAAGAVEEPTGIADALVTSEPLKPGHFLGSGADIDVRRVAKSTPFLVVMLILSLVGGWLLVQGFVETVTFVRIPIEFANYTNLDAEAQVDVQLEINKLIRSYPIRDEAWELLRQKQEMLPGFLNSGLALHRLDALTWEPNGTLQVRIDSDDPANDVIRLSTMMEAFYKAAQARNTQMVQNKRALAENQKRQLELLQQDAELKGAIEHVEADAQKYVDLKAVAGGMERFIELSEESNPLRLVARRNLQRMSSQVATARAASVKRDDLLAQRVKVQRDINDLQAEIGRLRRAIEIFVYPLPPEAKRINITDTRSHRTAILRNVWLGTIVFYIGIFFLIQYLDHREAENRRRERRLTRKTAPAARES